MRLPGHSALCLLGLLAGLGGLIGCTGSPSTPQISSAPLAAAPQITSFAASPATVQAGATAALTAVFSNGDGIINPGGIAVSSGVSVAVAPAATTTYTLTVTNAKGDSVSQAENVGVTAVLAPPLIAAFTAAPPAITPGGTASLTASFVNGNGVINPGNIPAKSGIPVTVSPAATTTYSLTVTNEAGSTLTVPATVTVNQPAAADAQLGVNIGWVNDWDPTQMFADAMKQARKFGSVTAPYDESASVDSLGWPTQDAGLAVIINNQGAWSEGSYALSFSGQATVKAWGDSNVSVGTVTYNAAANSSSATVTLEPGYQSLYLVFTNTKRTAASATGSGVTNVSLMRPMIDGSPHAAGTVFTDRFLARLKYFSAMRIMDYLSTNGSTETVWTDRSIPAYASQQEVPPHPSQDVSSQYVTGASYEYAIQLANQANKDLWLNIPHLAFGGTYRFSSTAWATNLALLLKFGSDANGNPYTGLNGSAGANPQPAAGPVNPGLNPGLHVYIEWSNEFWSGVGSQSNWIEAQANAAIAAADPDLDWDHDSDQYDLMWRINARGVMEIANAFAGVYGAQSFGSVYRPVFAGQIANSGTYAGLSYLDTQHGGARQYVWAIAGGAYVDFNGDLPGNSMTSAQVITGMQSYQTANIVPWIESLSAIASAEQLDGGMVIYEGGQGAAYTTAGALAAQTLPPMRGVTTTVLDAWSAQSGAATFFYYKLCSADMWGLATDISYDIDADTGYNSNPAASTEAQPKWGAIKQVATLGH